MVNAGASPTDANAEELADLTIEPTDEVAEEGDHEVLRYDGAVLRSLIMLYERSSTAYVCLRSLRGLPSLPKRRPKRRQQQHGKPLVTPLKTLLAVILQGQFIRAALTLRKSMEPPPTGLQMVCQQQTAPVRLPRKRRTRVGMHVHAPDQCYVFSLCM